MIDFRTKKTRIRVLQSIFYVFVVAVFVNTYGKSFYHLLAPLVSSFIEIDTYSMRRSFSLTYGNYFEETVLYFILLSPLWISLLVMPLYRSIKRWVSRGQ